MSRRRTSGVGLMLAVMCLAGIATGCSDTDSSPPEAAAARATPATAAVSTPPAADAARVSELVAAVQTNGFALEAGAAGDVEDFRELVELTAESATPWYFVSVATRPNREFTAELRERITPLGNVITYWTDTNGSGTQAVTDRFDQEDDFRGPTPDGITPTFVMRIMASSADPGIDTPTSDEQIALLLRAFPGVSGRFEVNKIVLTGQVETFDERARAAAVVALFPTTIDNQIVVRPAGLDAALASYPDVRIEIVNNVVILSGSVTSNAEWTEVGRAARANTDQGVRNEVRIEVRTTLLNLLDRQPELSTLRSLLGDADLTAELSGPGPLTVFMPTNDAFAALGPELDVIRADPERLRQLLLGHVMATASTLGFLSGMSHPTLADGVSIDIATIDGSPMLNDEVSVLVSATADNGKMHILPEVLIGS